MVLWPQYSVREVPNIGGFATVSGRPDTEDMGSVWSCVYVQLCVFVSLSPSLSLSLYIYVCMRGHMLNIYIYIHICV